MKTLKSKLLFSLFSGFLLFGFFLTIFSLLKYQKYRQFTFPELKMYQFSLKEKLKGLEQEIVEIDFSEITSKETINYPDYYQPNINISKAYLQVLSSVEKCKKIDWKNLNDPQIVKIQKWYEHNCLSNKLDKEVWSLPPYNHPLGGSWAFWIWKKKQYDEAWLSSQKDYLHVLEYSHVNSEFLKKNELFYKKLNLNTWSLILQKLNTVANENYLFLLESHFNSKLKYSLYNKSEVDERIKGQPYVLASSTKTTCLQKVGSYCWVSNEKYLKKSYNKWLYVSGVGIFLFVFSIMSIVFMLRKQYERQRQLMAQTLAHELRHPVTSMNLSLEFFRDRIDGLDEELQIEVLRMIDELRRLKLLVKASENYLVTGSGDKTELKPIVIRSVNSYLKRIADSYGVDFIPIEGDKSLRCDAYWLGVCIENLIKNGLKHGEKPVLLKVEFVKENLKISVQDSGKGIEGDYRNKLNKDSKGNLSDGMGLGLSITNKVIDLMGAKLTYDQKPSIFTIHLHLKESENEKNSAA